MSKNQTMLANSPGKKPNFLRTTVMRFWPLLVGLVALALFPFGWLTRVWPAFGHVVNHLFGGTRAHHIGNSLLFFVVGLLALICLPVLRSRPLLYFGLMLAAPLAHLAVESLFKLHFPSRADATDLLFDVVGFIIAYLVVWGWQSVLKWKKV